MLKLKYVFTFVINDYLYLQLTLHLNYFYFNVYLRKLESSFLSVSCKVSWDSSVYYILYVLFISSIYFECYVTLYNAGPLSHLTYLLIYYGILFIMKKLEGRDINRVAWLNKINAVSLRKRIEDYNGVLNYYTLMKIYTLIISRPLFWGIILLELYIIASVKYECNILYHSKQSHGTVNVGKCIYALVDTQSKYYVFH